MSNLPNQDEATMIAIIDMLHKAFPGYLKILKARHHGSEFDTEEFIADFIAPMEAKIKAIREQQALITGNDLRPEEA